MAKKQSKDRKNYYRLLGIVIIMVLFGLVMVLSASSVQAYANTGDAYYYIKKQLFSLLLGFVVLFIFSQISMRSLQKLAPYGTYAVIAMLAAVLVPGVGKSAGGSSRWIPLAGFHLQPSELAKFAVVLYTADFLARRKNDQNDIRDLIYPYGLVVATISVLVLKQPDLGTTVSICLTAFALIFIGGFNLRYIAGIGFAGLIAGTYAIYSAKYRFERFTAFLNPNADPLGAGYHIRQGLIAFGSGGLFGVGLGMSRQKYFYLPAAFTDFIFAIIGEELGLLGTLFTILLFVAFAYYGIRISFQSKNPFGQLLGAGLTSMVVLQALVNMGATTAVLPITGIPMPFISYGGSSLIVNLAAVGIILSVAIENEREASRRRNSRLYRAVDDGSNNRATARLRKKVQTNKRTTSSSKSRTRTSKSAGTSKTRSASLTKGKIKRGKSNASSNKRRRDGRARVSRAGSRQGTSRNKRKS